MSGTPIDLKVILALEPVALGPTRATYGAAIQPHGRWRLLALMLAAEGEAGPERELRRLIENVEKGPAPAAASDLDRARRWYEERLGLTPEKEEPGGVWYRFAGDTRLYLYGTGSAWTARNTIAGGTVPGVEAIMADLRSRGSPSRTTPSASSRPPSTGWPSSEGRRRPGSRTARATRTN